MLTQGLKQLTTDTGYISLMSVERLTSNMVAIIELCQVDFVEVGSHNLKLW